MGELGRGYQLALKASAGSNHGTAWPFGFCQARDGLMLAAAAAQRLPDHL